MRKRWGSVALECFVDLGITVVYAIVVGLLIVGIVASDDGPVSISYALVYAMLLPGTALALIAAEIGLRILKEWRTARQTAAVSLPVLER